MRPRAGARWLTAFLWLSAGWVLLSDGPALAHARLVQAEPAEGATLAESPDRVELRFSEPVDAEFSPLEVRDSEGNRVDGDDARADPEDARVILASLEEVPEGTYDVHWRVTSIDGHVVEGHYEFTVTGAAGDESPDDAGAAQRQQAQERTGQSAGEGAEQEDSAPVLTYSALSLGVLAALASGVFLLSRLSSRHRA